MIMSQIHARLKVWRRHILLVLSAIVAFSMLPLDANCADRYQVYFVAIGSSWYVSPAAPNQHGFSRLRGANKSAKEIADRLQRGGARFGVVLTSNDGSFVSMPDINNALDRVLAQIRADRPSTPLIFFYFVGHGISEGVAWNHFSMPGNFTYRGDPSRLPVDVLADKTLHAATLADKLDKTHFPYLVLLDTCYEGTEARFDSPVLTGPAIESLRSVANVLRVMNEFHQDNPILFSTEPGTVVSTVPDPTDAQSDPVGPLARRVMILLDGTLNTRHDLSLGEFVTRMASTDLDQATKPAITHAERGNGWDRSLVFPSTSMGRVETLTGTARSAEVCCELKTNTH
jgi:hypothetical protein